MVFSHIHERAPGGFGRLFETLAHLNDEPGGRGSTLRRDFFSTTAGR